MAKILSNFGSGGSGLYPGAGTPDLATCLRDIADDLAGIQAQLPAGGSAISVSALSSSAPGALTSAQAGALTSAQAGALTSSQNSTTGAAVQSGGYVQADVQTIATLANALKASLNQLQADVAALRTSYNQAQVDIAAIRTSYNAAQVDVAAIRTGQGTIVADLGTIRTAVNGRGGGSVGSYVLLTTKG